MTDTNCICCLSTAAHNKASATASALAAVVGLGVDQVMRDLCVSHRETVNGAVRFAQRVHARSILPEPKE